MFKSLSICLCDCGVSSTPQFNDYYSAAGPAYSDIGTYGSACILPREFLAKILRRP